MYKTTIMTTKCKQQNAKQKNAKKLKTKQGQAAIMITQHGGMEVQSKKLKKIAKKAKKELT